MKTTIRIFLTVSCLVQPAIAQTQSAGGSRRIALVIGNKDYSWKPLTSPLNDARAVAGKLRALGFKQENILTGENLGNQKLRQLVFQFIEKIRPGDTALVYFSGHGVEVGGANYLLPVDLPGDATKAEGADAAVSAQELLQGMQEAGAQVRILILDACRAIPLGNPKPGEGGLAPMAGVAANGALVVFAAAAGRTAEDSPEAANSLFTQHLLAGMDAAGVNLNEVMKQVASAVTGASGGKQTPALYGSVREDFALLPRIETAPAAPKAATDAEAYAEVRDSGNPELLLQFADLYPNSPLAEAARLKAAALRGPEIKPATATHKVGDERQNPKDGQTYVWIPPGRFKMGCSDGDKECRPEEKPAHEVTISKGFWLGQTEVTVGAWKKYRKSTGKPELASKDDFGRNLNEASRNDSMPVVMVSWVQSSDFCGWAGGRLPTEAEWEYAARAGSTADVYGRVDAVAWYADNSGKSRINSTKLAPVEGSKFYSRMYVNKNGPHPVAKKERNAWKLFDMLGNASEWVVDWYGKDYYSSGATTDPQGPPKGECGEPNIECRVMRGGSWSYIPKYVQATLRTYNLPRKRDNYIGLRCAWDSP